MFGVGVEELFGRGEGVLGLGDRAALSDNLQLEALEVLSDSITAVRRSEGLQYWDKRTSDRRRAEPAMTAVSPAIEATVF